MAAVNEQKNCKLRALSNEYCLDFIGQSINEIIHLAPFRHCLRPSKWRVRRPAGRHFRPYDKLSYSSELPLDVESKLCTHLIVAQRTSELQPDFTSIPPLPQLEKLIATNFRLNKDGVIEHFAPSFCEYTVVRSSVICRSNVCGAFRYLPLLLALFLNVALDQGPPQQLLLGSAARCPQDTGRGECSLTTGF